MSDDKVVSVSEIMAEVEESMRNDTRTNPSTIVLMGPLNKQPDRAVNGWIGLYVDSVRYDPRTAGGGMGNWNSTTVVRVIVQHADMNDPKVAFEKLSSLVKAAIDVLLANRMLAGYAENVPSIEVSYATRDSEQATLYFQAALVTMTFVGRSTY